MLPAVKASALQVVLDQIAASRRPDAHLVLVLDCAGWHKSRDHPNITLVVLPPYAPELNPVERIWLYLRNASSHALLGTPGEITDACRNTYMRLLVKPTRIKSLCNYPSNAKVVS